MHQYRDACVSISRLGSFLVFGQKLMSWGGGVRAGGGQKECPDVYFQNKVGCAGSVYSRLESNAFFTFSLALQSFMGF